MPRRREDSKNYLKEGKQTKITPRIKAAGGKVKGEGLESIFNLLTFVRKKARKLDHSSKAYQTYIEEKHIRRTADEIVSDWIAPTCSEVALVFATFCRAKGIPAKMVEGVLNKFLNDPSDKHLRSHVFVEVFLMGKRYLIDPSRGIVGEGKTLQDFISPYAKWELLWEGLDFWEAGIFNHQDLWKRSLQLKKQWKKKR